MNNQTLQRLSRNAMILAVIIAVSRLLSSGTFFLLPQPVHRIIYMVFPHEVFDNIRSLLFFAIPSPMIRNFPLFSILLAVFLVIGAVQLKQGKTFALKFCYFILIVSILISIPGVFTGYFFMLEQYNKYQANPQATSGILALIETFAPKKPSIPLLVAQLVILLGYIAWSGFQLKAIFSWEKAKAATQKV